MGGCLGSSLVSEHSGVSGRMEMALLIPLSIQEDLGDFCSLIEAGPLITSCWLG